MGKNKQLDILIERYPRLDVCRDNIFVAFEKIRDTYRVGGKLLICGNGGSAADSDHIVGELMKSFRKQRSLPNEVKESLKKADLEYGKILAESLQGALPAIALNNHSALSTAYLNDVNGQVSFAQQVYGYGKKEDSLLAITTSGNSKNVVMASLVAKQKGMEVIALTGNNGGKIKDIADVTIKVPDEETYRIQEYHLPIYHCLCLMLENEFFG